MKKIRPVYAILITLFVLLFSVTSAFAWLAVSDFIAPNLEKGVIVKQYFHTGDGSAQDPFVITRPVHFYNMVELFQRKDGFAAENYHFQLGYDLDGSGTLKFYNYDDQGKVITTEGNRYSTELNMQYYSGDNALLPTGTSDVPFNAEFDGSGLTVKNLYIRPTETIDGNTYGTADVGIWGYVDGNANIHDTYFKNVTLDLTGTDAARTHENHNSNIHDSDDADTTPDLVYVGYIAGHIKIAATVQDVYINNCTILGGDAARSGFGYFGCVEQNDGTPVTTLGSEVATLRGAGDDAGFGGSINMKNIYHRLMTIFTGVQNTTAQYVDSETVVIDEVPGGSENKVAETQHTTNVTNFTYTSNNRTRTVNYRYYYSETGGSFNFPSDNATSDTGDTQIYECLYGESVQYPKTVTTYIYRNEFPEAWYISDGTQYLTVSGTSLTAAADKATAAKWLFDESGHLYTYIEESTAITKYYLNRTGTAGVTLGTTPASVWTRDESEEDSYSTLFYTAGNGTNYYLDYKGGWLLTTNDTWYAISDGAGHFLAGDASTVSNAASAEAGAKWQLSDPTGASTTISTLINGTVYYLRGDGTLSMGTTPTTWTKDGNRYYVTVQGIRHYLVYDGAWKLLPVSGVKITDGADHFLTASTAGTDNAAAADAAVWQFTADTGDTQIYTVLNGQKYYLTYDGGLTVSTTAATWHRSGNALYITSGGHDYYLGYNGGWQAVRLDYFVIHDGSGHYLRVTGANAFASGDEASATHFYFSTENGASSSGTVYCVVGGNTYYLRSNNGALQTAAAANATAWTNDGAGHLTASGSNYRLGYDNGWKLMVNETYYVAYDGSGHYINASGTALSTDTSANLTHWSWADNRLSVRSGNSNYYLRVNVTTSTGCGGTTTYDLTLGTSTENATWSRDNSNRYYVTIDNTNYYIRYNNGWTYTTTQTQGTPLTIRQQTDDPLAYVAAKSDAAPEVQQNDAASAGTDVTLGGPYDEQLTLERTTQQVVEKTVETGVKSGNPTYFPLRVDRNADGSYPDGYAVSEKNTGYIISGANIYASTATDDLQRQRGFGDIRVAGWPVSYIANSYSSNTGLSASKIRSGNNYLYLAKQDDDSYAIANTTNANLANFWHYDDDNRLKTVIGSKTYYLTYDNGLALSTTPGVAWTFSNNNRLAYNNNYIKYNNGWTATTGNQNLTLTLGKINTVYTFDDSSNTVHALTDAQKTDAFNRALMQLSETLAGSTHVFGLHFMDAAISTDHLITAPYASIFNQAKTNYELPEDSIDFNVIERGTINFFAGEYFTNNNAFFSLHQVFRYTAEDQEVIDGEKRVDQIKAIKEITEVYKHATGGDKEPYIYKFKDNTYSNADASYTGATTLDPAYSSTPAFKTSWITAPNGLSSNSTRIYYFEIPCNAGEYCLGSVSGKTGAYLIYLDIAANGGDTLAAAISSEGNDTVNAFNVEFRESPDTTDHTVLQFSVDAPDEALNKFSVNVTFDPTATTAPHTAGLYTITLVNNSTEDLTLYVYLCDDDFNMMTPFPYAYRVVYTNASHTSTVLSTTYGEELQVMAGFTIPASGDALEVSYH